MAIEAPFVRLEPDGEVTLFDSSGPRQKMRYSEDLGRWRSIDPPEPPLLVYPRPEPGPGEEYYVEAPADLDDDDVPF